MHLVSFVQAPGDGTEGVDQTRAVGALLQVGTVPTAALGVPTFTPSKRRVHALFESGARTWPVLGCHGS